MRKGNSSSGRSGKRVSQRPSGSQKKTFRRTDTSDFKKSDRKSLGDKPFSPRSSKGKFDTRSSSSELRSAGSFKKNSSRNYRSDNPESDRKNFRGTNPSGDQRSERKNFEDKPFSSRASKGKFDKRSSSSEQRSAGTFKKSSSRKYGSSEDHSSERKNFRKTDSSADKKSERRSFGDKPFSPRSSSGRKFDKRRSSSEQGDKESFKKDFSRKYKSDKSESSEFKSSFIKKRYSPRKRTSDVKDPSAEAASGKIRLNKFISNSGVCSRREADELIKMGLISVNGKVVTELGFKVNPTDDVRHENKILRAEKPVYILLNKPKGFLTTTNDPQERDTVMHLIANAVKERVYPVGRLDRNTTGLLLLTNDGDLAEKLSHPSYNVKKIYKVELDRRLTTADFQKIRDGVRLEEGKAMVDDLAVISDDGRTVGLELHIGWNRVVRRIFESLDYEVLKLDRSVYAGLDKKDLSRGKWRFLRNEEVIKLKHFK